MKKKLVIAISIILIMATVLSLASCGAAGTYYPVDVNGKLVKGGSYVKLGIGKSFTLKNSDGFTIKGKYETEVKEEKVKDPETGEDKTQKVTLIKWKTDSIKVKDKDGKEVTGTGLDFIKLALKVPGMVDGNTFWWGLIIYSKKDVQKK